MGTERDGELRPLLTAVVQVVKYQKTSEEHARMAYKELYGRPYLFVLNPAAIKASAAPHASTPSRGLPRASRGCFTRAAAGRRWQAPCARTPGAAAGQPPAALPASPAS
jgi:hypothetical protein